MLAALKLFDNRRGIGDHREAVAMKQAPRQFVYSSAAFEKNSLAIENQALCFSSDRLFFGTMAAAECFVGRLKIRARSARHRTAMRANQHSFFFQSGEITPDRRGRDAQHANQVSGRDASLARENLANAKSSFFGQQAHQTAPHVSKRRKQADCATTQGQNAPKTTKYVIFDKIRLTNAHKRTN